MLRNLIETKLQTLKKPVVVTGDDYIMTTCLNPSHKDKNPSFHINLKTGEGQCFSCKFKVNSSYWTDGELDEEQIEALERDILYDNLLNEYKETDRKTEFTNIIPPKSKDVPDGWRGLSKETFDKFGIYICEKGYYQNRVIFPIKDDKGDFVAFNTRALGDEKPKYKYSKGIQVNKLLYPPLEKTDKLVIVEGIMDALSMVEAGIPAVFNYGVSYTFSSSKISQLLKAGVETIYLAFDNDEAGLKAVQTYLNSELKDYFEIKHARLLPELEEFYKSDFKDFSEYYEGIKNEN